MDSSQTNGEPSDFQPDPTPPFDVLLVEHDALAAKNLRHHLSSQNAAFQFHQVRDGAEALDFLKHRDVYEKAPTPQLVILNVNVPSINGYQVLGVMREMDELKTVPTIVIEKEGVHAVNAQALSSTVDAVRNFLLLGLKAGKKSNPAQPAVENVEAIENPSEDTPQDC